MAAKKSGGGGVIDRAVAHFQNREVRIIEVPEWGDENGPLEVYVAPFTLREQTRLQKSSGNGADANVLADVLIMKALDSGGEKLFTLEDKQAIKDKVDATVLARVAAEIMAVDPDAIEKN